MLTAKKNGLKTNTTAKRLTPLTTPLCGEKDHTESLGIIRCSLPLPLNNPAAIALRGLYIVLLNQCKPTPPVSRMTSNVVIQHFSA